MAKNLLLAFPVVILKEVIEVKITDKNHLRQVVDQAIQEVQITDLHTHLYSDSFGELLLWGIDELLTYHYLIAEYFRCSAIGYDEFFALSKQEQADLIWQTLFIDHSPVSESQRGVLTILNKLGLDLESRDLEEYRQYFASLTTAEYVDKVFELSNVKEVVMTNDPFDSLEKPVWDSAGNEDERFKTALRLDFLLNNYDQAYLHLQEWGYQVSKEVDEQTIQEVRRFVTEWVERMDALYMAASLPPDFTVPEDSVRSRLLEQAILPACRDLKVPFAMMIGINRQVNPKLRMAGDAAAEKADIRVVEYLCRTYPENKFMITYLLRDHQHELTIMARKFRNLMVFGCWWFLNNPSLIEETTRMRMELMGLSFIPQHSDARVLDQLIYKWDHSKQIIGRVLLDKYSDLLDANWALTEEEVTRDVADLFSNNFWRFLEQ